MRSILLPYVHLPLLQSWPIQSACTGMETEQASHQSSSTVQLPERATLQVWQMRFTKSWSALCEKLSHQCLLKYLTCNLNHSPNVFRKLMRIIQFIARENTGKTYMLILLYRLKISRVVKRPNNQCGTCKTLPSTLSQDLNMYVSHKHAFPTFWYSPQRYLNIWPPATCRATDLVLGLQHRLMMTPSTVTDELRRVGEEKRRWRKHE